MAKYAVIVDPYSSGSLLASRFRQAGVLPIALHLRPLQGKLAKSFVPDDFDFSYVYDGNVEHLLETLSQHEIAIVVPGQEAGVELADVLCHRLGLKHNPMHLLRSRRDKYEMHQRLAEAGLRSMAQVKTSSLAEIEQWVREHGRWPVVIKPVDSGGTDGVKICADLEQVRAAHAAIIARTNLLGFANEQIIAQEFIRGTEYVVDAVSCDGQHFITSMTRYRKEILDDGSPIYKEMHFFTPSEAVHHEVVEYTRRVLDILGVQHGPSHTEVFVDELGPVLVESGARLFGGLVPRYVERATTVSPLSLTIDSYVDEAGFHAKTSTPQQYARQLVIWMMSTPKGGRVTAQPGRELLPELASYNDIIWFNSVGEEIKKTTDIVSGIGLLILIHDKLEQIQHDLGQVANWENAGRLISVA